MNFSPKLSEIFPYTLLPLLCLFVDEVLKIPWINKKDILKAGVDNFGHGAIALLSWLAVVGLNRRGFAESVLCGVLACLIDLDHFFMAKSCFLKDALSLAQRPPLHSSSILVPVLPPMIILTKYYPYLFTLPYLTAVSVLSHHLRDGCRRGIWFWPLGSSPAIPYWLYLLSIILLPFLISLIMNGTMNRDNLTSIVYSLV